MSEPEYAWPTVADYENDVGLEVNQAFKMGWGMARTTNSFLNQLAGVTPQPAQQEPVAWGVFSGTNLHDMFFTEEEAQELVRLKGDGSIVQPLYTSPPAQRTWVGLTPEEVQEIHDTYHKRMGPQEFASMVEAKLKENT